MKKTEPVCGVGVAPLLSGPPVGGDLEVMRPFEKLIGDWNLDIVDMHPDGTTTRHRGTWHFYWGLGGKAILDVWHVPGREQGLTVRFYDPSIAGWRSTWLAPQGRLIMLFLGRYISEEIVLENRADDGTVSHWIFSDITQTTFRWRGEISRDDGRSWQIEQTMIAERRFS